MRPFLLLVTALLPLAAQSIDQPLSLFNADPIDAFRLVRGDIGSGRMERVSVSDQAFPEALSLTTTVVPNSSWNLRVRALGNGAVKKDDTILATFWARCVEPAGGECALILNVEQAVSPYTKSASTPFIIGPEWKQFRFIFRMAEDYAPGGYYVDFWMSQLVQVAEVGGMSFSNYGPGVKATDLGIDALYDGAAADAPWRIAAEERIDQIRKGDLTVAVTDPDGNPIAAAEVRVRMKRHAFGWGTAVAASVLFGTKDDNEKYRQFILDNFNCVVLENDLKWPSWDTENGRIRALQAVQWFHDNGIHKIRGHNLVWPSWQYLPAKVKALENDPEALRQLLLDHIQDEVTANRGTLMDWDVINEAYTNRDLQKILGDDEMVRWFQVAREYDPDVKLFINDYNIIAANGANILHRNGYFDIITFLLSKDAPVDGIGMQGHFGSPTAPETMLRIIDRFATFNKQIEITEFDFNSSDEELQAQFTRDLLITAFSHPSMTNFLMWGFWEGQHWLPRGAMVRQDWTTKPNYDVWRELVYTKWWTNELGATGEDGLYALRGFLGDYEIEVTAGEKTLTIPVTLTKDGAVVRAVLE
ncbi:MAG: endo-1,4-beta-xylanase [Bryobacterales bacterium]|nr:endo-1,4-beta-xylanase [Bryobacterales bacterium]